MKVLLVLAFLLVHSFGLVVTKGFNLQEAYFLADKENVHEQCPLDKMIKKLTEFGTNHKKNPPPQVGNEGMKFFGEYQNIQLECLINVNKQRLVIRDLIKHSKSRQDETDANVKEIDVALNYLNSVLCHIAKQSGLKWREFIDNPLEIYLLGNEFDKDFGDFGTLFLELAENQKSTRHEIQEIYSKTLTLSRTLGQISYLSTTGKLYDLNSAKYCLM